MERIQTNNMFKPIFFLLAVTTTLYISCNNSLNNKKRDQVITEKGILFLSNNNVYYIDSLKDKDHIETLFLRDVFLPLKKTDVITELQSAFFTENLKEGIELGILNNRKELKAQAASYPNDSSFSPCYTEKTYFILPVTLKYKLVSTSPEIFNCNNEVSLLTNNKKITFKYKTSSIEILQLQTIDKR